MGCFSQPEPEPQKRRDEAGKEYRCNALDGQRLGHSSIISIFLRPCGAYSQIFSVMCGMKGWSSLRKSIRIYRKVFAVSKDRFNVAALRYSSQTRFQKKS